MSSIVTFYSYKGGVGRSMALANIALLLARRGFRVLIVDWDLEAPGLERYFSYFKVDTSGGGLLRMLMGMAEGEADPYQSFLWHIHAETSHPISLLASGREQDSNYSANLEKFDWQGFFEEKNGGRILESLREQWRADFDYVLIDSRTGLSDTGGICTIQLPDVVVAMFTANHQSLYGVRDVMRLAQNARQSLAYDRMPLTILPLPSRFGTRAEFNESQEWIGRFEEALAEFYVDWLPAAIRPRQVLERIKVPQFDFFSFGEKLAVVEEGINNPEGMGFVYDKVAEVISNEFSDVEPFVGAETARQAREESYVKAQQMKERTVKPAEDYEYDIYVSYAHNSFLSEWIREVVQILSVWASEFAGRNLKFFFDVQEISGGDAVFPILDKALKRSKLLLVFANVNYFESPFALQEWRTFKKRSELTNKNLIFPILITRPAEMPDWFKEYVHYDLSDFSSISGLPRNNKDVKLERILINMAEQIANALKDAPPYNPKW